MDTRVARRFDVRALRRRPVLVVPDREENLVFAQLGSPAIGINAGRVADVVSVGLEPPEHRIFRVEQPVFRRVLDA